MRDAARGIDGAVATVGQVEVEPGGANVIPSRVRLSLDARAPDAERLDALVAAIGFEPTLPGRAGAFDGRGAQRRCATRSRRAGCPASSSPPAPGTTPGSSRRRASTPRCSSSAA